MALTVAVKATGKEAASSATQRSSLGAPWGLGQEAAAGGRLAGQLTHLELGVRAPKG